MNKLVEFSTARLLKEKGFIPPILAPSIDYYLPNGSKINFDYIRRNTDYRDWCYYSPTIAEVVMWIHKEKGLWVNVMYMGFELKYSWSIDIITTSGSDWDSYGEEDGICYKSPTEAYEAAIEYTLKNLI